MVMTMETRITRQKRILEEEFPKFKAFFTADDLLERAKKKDSKIGIATVYRFLRENATAKKIHSYSCDRRQVYSTQDNNHCHFICTQCGEVRHFNVTNLDSFKKNTEGTICHFQIDIHGICKKCQQTAPKS
jgi:Fur family transcriptional regulator, ferric uptake regulator